MDCIFCRIIDRTAPGSIIYEDDLVTAFMDIHPIRPGQCMVVPNHHIDHFTDVDDETARHIMSIAMRIGRRMREVFAPERVGMVVHGYGVAHAHLVIVPQHDPNDITSGRVAEVKEEKVVFRHSRLSAVDRTVLNEQAGKLADASFDRVPPGPPR